MQDAHRFLWPAPHAQDAVNAPLQLSSKTAAVFNDLLVGSLLLRCLLNAPPVVSATTETGTCPLQHCTTCSDDVASSLILVPSSSRRPDDRGLRLRLLSCSASP